MPTPSELLSMYSNQAQIYSFFTDKLYIISVLSYANNETINDGVTSASTAIQNAINAVSNAGGGVVFFPAGTYLITQTISLPSKVRLIGMNCEVTILKSGFAGRLFESLGDYGGQGFDLRIISSGFEHIGFDGNLVGLQGWYLKGGYRCFIKNCRFRQFKEEYVYLDQVFDTWIDETYFLDFYPTDYTKAMLFLNYGATSDTDEIHMNDCVFETFRGYAIKMIGGSGSGGNSINEIKLQGCKFETRIQGAPSATLTAPTVIYISDAVDVEFNQCNWAIAKSDNSTPTYGIFCNKVKSLKVINSFGENVTPENGVGTYSHPFIGMQGSSRDIFFIANRFHSYNGTMPHELIYDIDGTTSSIHIYGTILNEDSSIPLTNATIGNSNANTFNNSIKSISKDETNLSLIRNDGVVNVNYYLGRINNLGSYRLMNGETVIYEILQSTGNLHMHRNLVCTSAYNTNGLLQLGGYYFWVDSSGRLRIKNGAPTSDTDGTIVGTQS